MERKDKIIDVIANYSEIPNSSTILKGNATEDFRPR